MIYKFYILLTLYSYYLYRVSKTSRIIYKDANFKKENSDIFKNLISIDMIFKKNLNNDRFQSYTLKIKY